jgi:nucleoside-diphosphate-sugar epimerase
MRIAITGALGHIGSALTRHLRPAIADRVVLIDNLSTLRYCSLFNLPADVNFAFVEADVRTADLAALFDGVEYVVHLAAATNASESVDRGDEVEAINHMGTARVAEACLSVGARLLFVSTTSVYGSQSSVVDEDCSEEDLRPQSPYATSKLRAERLLARLGERGLRYVVVRFGTVFGVSIGMRFHTAINKFCWQACMGEPISVWRTALHQHRPYLDLTDAVRAIEFIISQDLFDNHLYNVLTLNTTIEDIVEILGREVRSLRIEYVDSPIMNQLSYRVRDERFRRAGFTCIGDLKRGIRETLQLLRASNTFDPRAQRVEPEVVVPVMPLVREAGWATGGHAGTW